MKTALVLSGGGMFELWQAGAWRALAERYQPDLIVGASVGSLNGYAIAAGATPDQLAAFWMRPELAVLGDLPQTVRGLMDEHRLTTDYAVVLTDTLRLKPRIFRNQAVTWRHLAASCAIPGVMRMYRIDARWHCDGGFAEPAARLCGGGSWGRRISSRCTCSLKFPLPGSRPSSRDFAAPPATIRRFPQMWS